MQRMELYLRNIGKIAEASVRIDGISVIAGENDTGKSTIGRVLFSTFNLHLSTWQVCFRSYFLCHRYPGNSVAGSADTGVRRGLYP